ncbi:MAG: tetratricopeptide repeat protein [Phycisphaeraceae bacterium]
MNHRLRKLPILALAAGLTAAGLTGCAASQEQHDQYVAEANQRWLGVRSGLMLEMAQQHFDTGDLEMAERSVEDAMQMDQTNPHLYVLAGRIALERSRLERAFHLFEQAGKLNPELPEPHYYKGLVLQRWQQFDRAHAAYEQAYQAQPDNGSYLMAMSEMLVQMQQVDQAIELLESKLTYFDQNAGIRAALGHLCRMQDRHEDAADYFKQASLLAPDSEKLREELALAQIEAGRHDAAISNLEQLLAREDHADRDGLRRALAGAYVASGRVDKGRNIYLKLARKPDPDATDWLRLAELAWKQDDLAATLTAANRVIRYAPDRHEGYLFAGLVWRERDRLDEALRMFDLAAERSDKSATPLILRGISLQKAGRIAAAADAYQQALDRNPADPRAQRLLNAMPASN